MPKPGNLERSSSRELGNQNRHESPKPLDNKRLHGGQGSHGEGEHGPHHESEGGGHEHDHNKGVEYEHEHDHNKRGEHDRRENHPDADPHVSEQRDSRERDLASLVKPSKEDTRVSSLLTPDQSGRSRSQDGSGNHTDYVHESPRNEGHEDLARSDSGTNPGEGHRHGDGRGHEGDLPPYGAHEKDPLLSYEVHEGDHSSFDQWQKEEERRQGEWSEKATNFAKDGVHRQLGSAVAGHDIKFDTGAPEQPGQQSSELPEYRAYKDDKGRMVVSDNRVNGTLPDLDIDDTDSKSKLTRVPLEEADPLLRRAGPENFSSRSDLQAYRRRGEKEVVIASPENEHKYKGNEDYEHMGSVDLSGSREREARGRGDYSGHLSPESQHMARQAGEYRKGYQEQYGNNGDYGRYNGDGNNRHETHLDKAIRLVQELKELVQALDHLRHGGSSSDQTAGKPSFLKKVSDALGDLSDQMLAAGTKVGDKD